jgi:hypothetical protein
LLLKLLRILAQAHSLFAMGVDGRLQHIPFERSPARVGGQTPF